LSKVNELLEVISNKLEHMSALQSATTELSRHVCTERLVLTAALESARQSAEFEKRLAERDSTFIAKFEQNKLALHELLADQSEAQSERIERHPLPDFECPSFKGHRDIQQAIALKIKGMRDDRDAFLSETHAQLMNTPELLPFFEDALQLRDGEHYWATLDPLQTLKRRP